jgi:hypothetical protein
VSGKPEWPSIDKDAKYLNRGLCGECVAVMDVGSAVSRLFVGRW